MEVSYLKVLLALNFSIGIVLCTVISPEPQIVEEGTAVTFTWRTTRNDILEVRWGLYDKMTDNAAPVFITVNPLAGVQYSNDLNNKASRYKGRVEFTGNLTIGLARFTLKNVALNDTNQYVANIKERGNTTGTSFPVRLTVFKAVSTTAPPATVTTIPELPTKTSTLSPPIPTTQAPSKKYIVKLNGTINITKENEPSDVKWYLRNQTYAVFISWSQFHNVTVEVYKQSSTMFIINLTLWFKTEVTKSELKIYVGILLDRIKNTSNFSSTIAAISTATPTQSPTTPSEEDDDCTTGVKVGCAIGLLIAVVIIVVIGVVIYRKKKEKKEWATWEKALVVIGCIVAIVIIIVIIVVFVDKCT